MTCPPSPHPSPRRGEGVAGGSLAGKFASPAQAAEANPASRLAIAGWILFEWAVQPFFTLITTFVYAPYFAASIVGDATRGQALWGFATAAAGLIIALLSPALGAIADAAGNRKPWIAGFSALLLAGSALLWFGKPADPASIVPVLAAFALGAVGAQCALVFFNSMMPTLVPRERLGRLSGTAWGVAYVGGLISLAATLGLLAASPTTGKTLLGFAPIFGLDPLAHEGDRATGPFTAIWLVAFAWPLFVFTPDRPRQRGIRDALRRGLGTLAQTLRQLPRERDLALFLLANMICADGLVALFAFGGIYAAGTFGWGTIQIGAFGILLTVTGSIGAFLGGKLDDRYGPKRVILGSLVILIVSAAAILTIDPDRIGLVPVAPPAPGEGLFASAAERAYLAIGLLIGAVAGPVQAAARSLLARLAPADRITQFFGLFALSGKITSFVGPLLVGIVTAVTASQKAGMAVLIAFFAAGALVLMRVNPSPAGEISAGSAARR
jgi:UMF1 family MFS transporter